VTTYRFDRSDGSCAWYHVRYLRADGSKAFYYAYPASPVESDQTLTDPHTGLQVSVAQRLPEPCDLVYRLPELLRALRCGVDEVWCPEGEKDAETLRAVGCVATTGYAGASHWAPEQAEWFRGYEGLVNIVADNDGPGCAEAVLKHDSLTALGVECMLLRPSDGFKDVSDLLASGGGVGDLEEVERDELATLGRAWLTPGRKREWSTYDVSVSFLSRVLERTGR
jgi:hypothetical protein